jgi:DNA-binding transcriptional LysR family regulator
MKNLNELQIFVAVARQRSFTRAAASLEISTAAVSRAVMSLEKRLAVRLFERTTRRLVVTEAGEIYLAAARRALDEAEFADAAVSQLTGQPRGTLRVAMPVTLARSSVAPRLADFLRTYRELRIEMTLRGGRIDPIAERLDIAFQTLPSKDSQIIQKRIAVVEQGLFATKRYLASAPRLRTPRDLAQHACLTMSTEHEGTTWTLRKGGRVEEVRLRGRVSVGDPFVHHQLCLDDAGIAVLPYWLARPDGRTHPLVRVLPGWTPPPVELYMLYPTRLSVTPKLKAFLAFVESVVPGRGPR